VHSIDTHFAFLSFATLFFYVFLLIPYILPPFFKAPERSSWNGALKGYYIGYKISDSRDQYLYKTIDRQSSSFSDQHNRKNGVMLNLTNVSSSSIIDPLQSPEQHHHSSSDTRVTLKGLKPLTEYIILVQAYNSFGAGPQSDGLLIKTTEDGEEERRSKIINHYASLTHSAIPLAHHSFPPFPAFLLLFFPHPPSFHTMSEHREHIVRGRDGTACVCFAASQSAAIMTRNNDALFFSLLSPFSFPHISLCPPFSQLPSSAWSTRTAPALAYH